MLVTAAAALFVGGSAGLAAQAAPPAPAAVDPIIQAASAPCFVSGYSWHAEQEMNAENITSDYVEHVVQTTCHSAQWQSGKKNWKYTTGRGGLTVIANSNGYVITVWRNR
ncbi:hypothetical protein OG203_30700 [Nocardia sp. NBC_01499]|uniref:hypothetical protein n=1 Tax=Nocardia sp. NBC_01499 TaxID=2903597 RepID=UPI003868AD0D